MPRGVKGSGKARPIVAEPAAAPEGPARSVDIDGLSGEALRTYARRIGVSRRDCDGLTEDRLRQNCKAFLAHHFELITED